MTDLVGAYYDPDEGYVETEYTLDTLLPGTSGLLPGYDTTGIAIFRTLDGAMVYALSNKCCHGKGQLYLGDIEDVDTKCVNGKTSGGSRKPGACVACPKHRKKFPGGLLFSLDEGYAFTKSETDHYNPSFRVATYPVAVDASGRILVRPTPHPEHPQLSTGERVALLAGKMKRNIWGKKVSANSTPKKDKHVYSTWSIAKAQRVTHNTSIYHFQGPAPHKRGYKALLKCQADTLWHLTLKIGQVDRDYTPISSLQDFAQGKAVIMIKLYPDGALTSQLAQLGKGDSVEMAVTAEKTLSLAAGGRKKGKKQHFAFIAGGTGLAPILQALRLVVSQGQWTAQAILSVQTLHDTVLHEEFTQCIEQGKGRISIHLCLSQHDVDEDGALPSSLDLRSIDVEDSSDTGDSSSSSSGSDDSDSSSAGSSSSSGSSGNTSSASSVDSNSDDDDDDDDDDADDSASNSRAGSSGKVTVSTGRMNVRLLRKLVPVPTRGDDPVTIVVSGPDGMWQDVRTMLVTRLGHDGAHAHGLEA